MFNKKYLIELADKLKDCPDETSFFHYIKWLSEHINQDAYEKYIYSSSEDETEHRPFLSIVMRTQGKRPEMLREVLLSLVGQVDMDFEVILIGHKLNDSQRKLVHEIIDEYNMLLEKKIRYFDLDHGSRTTPLNYGFANARGEYISILDDDDFVYANWVEEFHNAAKENCGQIIHANVLMQEWVTIDTIREYKALRSYGKVVNSYCAPFDFIKQINVNRCPIHGLAFPAYTFQKLGIMFDETLSTQEDWDFLMRTAFFAGVHDVNKVTAMYRIWINAENSHSIHDDEKWDEDRKKRHEKLKSIPLLIPIGGSTLEESVLQKTKNVVKMQLYYSGDGKFYETQSIKQDVEEGIFDISYELSSFNVSSLRLDPGINGSSYVFIKNIEMYFNDNTVKKISLKKIKTNGKKVDLGIVFKNDDPQIIWKVKKKGIKSINIKGSWNSLIFFD